MADLRSSRENADGARSRDDPGRSAGRARCEPGSRHQHEHAGQDEEPLGRFLVPVERAPGDYPLDPVFL